MRLRQRLALGLVPFVMSITMMGAQAQAKNPTVEIDTNMGAIVVELAPQQAPRTVANFLKYVDSGFYKNTIFHRVIPGFMIQGGGFDEQLNQKPTQAPIANEARGGLRNNKYTIAMARTNYPHSATSQFFINVADNDFLNADQSQDGWGYAVFGRVIKGKDVVDRISEVQTGVQNGMQDVPTKPVVIENVKRLP